MRKRNWRGWLAAVVAAMVIGVWLSPCASPLYAQTKRDKEGGEKEEGKGLSLKEARRLAVENNYDLQQAKKQLVDKKVTRLQYDARVARLTADVDRAYGGLYAARLELQLAQQRSARGVTTKIAPAKDAPKFPTVADSQDKALSQARQLAAFIPLEEQVALQTLNLKALLNAKAYPLRSDTEVVPTDRPVAMKKEIDEDAIMTKAMEHADRQGGPPVVRGHGAHPDRTASDFDNQKKRLVLLVKRSVLKAQGSVKRLEIAKQVREILQKRLDALVTSKADPADIAAAQDAVEDAGVKELRAILENNDALMDLGELTGTLQKDLNVESSD